MTLGNCNTEFLVLASPTEKPRESRFPMDSQKVEIVMESRKDSILLIPSQIGGSRRQHMRPSLHPTRKLLLLKPQPQRTQLSHSHTGIDHSIPPSIHQLLPPRERIRRMPWRREFID